jgi:predicted nucleic acid-binding protein
MVSANCLSLNVFGHAKYPQGPGSTQGARIVLRELIACPGHQFWPDAVSLIDAASYRELPGCRDLTDYYLLSLAIHQDSRLATLDKRIDPGLLPNGPAAFFPLS